MATLVIKRDGHAETFNPDKIKKAVKNAAQDAAYTPSQIRLLFGGVITPIINSVKKKEDKTIKTSEIREAILGELDKKHSKVSEAWRKYDSDKKERGIA